MIDRLYAIIEPGAERVYYQHSAPTEYQRKPGARIYVVDVVLPDAVVLVDGHIVVMPSNVEESTT